jgi:uncharacterized membrane protein
MALYKLLHILSVVIWVGGMFFAYMILRPGIGQLLKLPERMRLWDRVFNRFFKWVWLAVFLLLSTGFYLIYLYGGMSVMPRFIHLMLLSGIVMMLIFVYLFFGCYVHFNQMVEEKEWHQAEERLVAIRKLVAVNLVIGLLTIAVAIIGRG